MKRFYIFAALFCFAGTAHAETYFDQIIRQKQQAAEQKRIAGLQQVEARRADPEGYIKAKSISLTPINDNVESFKIASDGHYYVPASINHQSINFMADTGATAIFISQSDAKAAGINPQTLQYNQQYTTANGAHGRAAIAVARTLTIGSIEMRDVPVVVSMEQNHVALLGMEFFNRLKRYEVSGGKLSMYE